MRVTPEMVKLARETGRSPMWIARWTAAFDRWIQAGKPSLHSKEARGLFADTDMPMAGNDDPDIYHGET